MNVLGEPAQVQVMLWNDDLKQGSPMPVSKPGYVRASGLAIVPYYDGVNVTHMASGGCLLWADRITDAVMIAEWLEASGVDWKQPLDVATFIGTDQWAAATRAYRLYSAVLAERKVPNG